MRHFRIDSDSALILSLTNVLLKQNGVTYTFIPDGNKENMGYKIGIYDIYVDETKFEIPSSIKLLEQYELIEIQRKVYDRLIDKNAEKSYSELFSKYKVIEEERNKYADEKLKEQRKAILEDVLEYYKAHCIVPFEQIKDVEDLNFENGTFRHIGYCTVVKTNYKNCFYPSGEYFKVDKNETEESFDTLNFFKVENEGFHTLVWQTVGICGDDYSGYILYPMNDGRYWVVSFCNI